METRPRPDADDTVPNAPGAASRSRPSRPAIGDDLAALVVADPEHFAIVHEIARGGMGRVLLARDRRLGRDVAVKEMIADVPAIARRFEREARITARLQHPSIIAVHEAGRWPSGEPFYVMPVVTGRPLDDAIGAAFEPAARMALVPHVLAIADAMAYAHGHAIIHRDLKPRNVLIGGYGETVVLDWGLAKDLEASEPSEPGPPATVAARGPATVSSGPGDTTIGEVIGTPAYMPPEQALGQPVDARADVYAIGAILYHVLAGRPPFVARSSVELLASVVDAPPPRLAGVVPDVAGELVAIVERAMARDAAARYPNARELADDLRRFQTGQLVGAHRYSVGQLVRRWLSRHRTALAALAAAVAASVAIGVVALRRVVAADDVARDERAEAVARRHDAEDLMQFMLVDLHDKLAEVGRLDLLEAVAHRAVDYYSSHDTTTGEDSYLEAVARLGLAGVLESRGDLTGAFAQYSEAWSTLEAVAARYPDVGKYDQRALDAGTHVAEIEAAQGDTTAALDLYRTLSKRAERALDAGPSGIDALRIATVLRARVGSALEDQGDYDGALGLARGALALAERSASLQPGASTDKRLLNAHAQVGHILFHGHIDTAAALVEYRLALGIGERLVAREPHDPRWLQDLAICHEDVGSVLADQADTTGALAAYRDGLAALERALAIDPTNTEMVTTQASLREKVGMMLLGRHDYASAAAEFTACDAVWSQLTARDPTNTEWALGRSMIANKLGDVKLAANDVRGALAHYRSALAMREQLVAKDPSNAAWRRDLFYSHYKLATAYRASHDRPSAIGELRAAMTVADASVAARPNNRQSATDAGEIRVELGDDLLAGGDIAGAHLAYVDGLAIARALLARTPSDSDTVELVVKLERDVHRTER